MTHSDAPPSPAPPATIVSGDAPCAACGYNLRGLDPAGRCPECGTGVVETLARGGRAGYEAQRRRESLGIAAAILLAAKGLWLLAGWTLPGASWWEGAVAALAGLMGPKLWQAAWLAEESQRSIVWPVLVFAGLVVQAAGAAWLARTARTFDEWRVRVPLFAYAAVLPVGGLACLIASGWRWPSYALAAAALLAIPAIDLAGTLLVWRRIAVVVEDVGGGDRPGAMTAIKLALILGAIADGAVVFVAAAAVAAPRYADGLATTALVPGFIAAAVAAAAAIHACVALILDARGGDR